MKMKNGIEKRPARIESSLIKLHGSLPTGDPFGIRSIFAKDCSPKKLLAKMERIANLGMFQV